MRRSSKHSPEIDLSTLVYGKIPPQAKEIETAVLGAIMLVKYAFETASEILTAESFYVDAHQRVFRACQSLASKGSPIDEMTVVEELNRKGELETVGGPYFVTKLTNAVVSAANIVEHSMIIKQKFLQRELIRIGGEMIHAGFESSTDPFELLDECSSQLAALSSEHVKRDVQHIEKPVMEAAKDLEIVRNATDPITGVRTGSVALDKITNGWQKTDLIILAARPAVGKTAYALNLALAAANDGDKAVAIFSLEMSAKQLVQRLLSRESEVPLEKIKTGRDQWGTRITDDEVGAVYSAMASISGTPMYIDDSAALTTFELRGKLRRLAKKGLGLVIIDYLQLMNGDAKARGNREQEISQISRELKKIAKDFDVPVIALSQLSRAVEQRGNKEPQLSDLRESGAIEQDADMVMFLYRPSEEDIQRDPSLEGTGITKIAKHRNGNLGNIPLKFLGHIQKWQDVGEVIRTSFRPLTVKESVNFSEPRSFKDTESDLPF